VVKIVTVGAAVQDVFLSNSDAFAPVCTNPDTCFEVLELGSKADVNTIFFGTGGGATNAAVTFARQGLDVKFLGVIGHDPAGQAVLDELDREDVDTSLLKYSDTHNTGFSVLLVAPGGERTILTYRGASTKYRARDMSVAGVEADWLYVTTLAGSMSVLDHLFSQAKEAGMKILFNPGKLELAQRDQLRGLLEDVDILLANKQEMKSIVEGETLEELVRHALHIVPMAIVTDGGNGVAASDGKTLIRAGMYQDQKVVDQTGAGDAFGSGFLSQWVMGKSLRESVLFASANSSSVIRKMGAKSGILHKGAALHDMPMQEVAL
jgi:sugar/nucleoside kinase (ribokinase family)